MENRPDIQVSVVYAQKTGEVWRARLVLPPGTTLLEAVRASGFEKAFPAYDLNALQAGVFGLARPADAPLRDGDRVEIYRPLAFDPMESRRRRALHRAKLSPKR